MAIKDTNHRIAVTLDNDAYADLQVMASDMGGKSVSKAAAKAVRGYVDAQNMVIDLRTALDLMAGDLVSTCWQSGMWSSVWVSLAYSHDCKGTEGEGVRGETRYSLLRQLSESGPLMGGVYRRSYIEWCEKEGKVTFLD